MLLGAAQAWLQWTYAHVIILYRLEQPPLFSAAWGVDTCGCCFLLCVILVCAFIPNPIILFCTDAMGDYVDPAGVHPCASWPDHGSFDLLSISHFIDIHIRACPICMLFWLACLCLL